jgi:queuosine precursor transporter
MSEPKKLENLMKKTTQNLVILSCFFVACLIVSNVIACKVVQIGWILIPAAVIAYPITFLCTDVISELWGKAQANKTVALGFIVQVCMLGLFYLAMVLPAIDPVFQEQFSAVIGTSVRFVIASLLAYIVSQTFDVNFFHFLKCKFKPKWIRNNGTMVSQLFDTAIFITIGFWGIIPELGVMIVSQYIVKVILAACDTPIFYYLTRNSEKNPNEVYNENC